MLGETPGEPVLFFQEGLLELHHIAEPVLPEKCPRGIDLPAVFVFLTPAPDWIESKVNAAWSCL